jgi:hypothetical protein
MSTRRFFAMALMVLFIFGCVSSNKLNNVRLGMDKKDVIAAMGEPDSTSAIENTVYLRYKLWSGGFFSNDYFVQLIDGKVEAYGRVGDFGLGY